MSQQKVDYYKKQKVNRKKIVKAEKRNRIIGIAAAVIIVCAALTWFGVSIYQNSQPEKSFVVETDYSALDNYLNTLTY